MQREFFSRSSLAGADEIETPHRPFAGVPFLARRGVEVMQREFFSIEVERL
jgi:hypothetical protein